MPSYFRTLGLFAALSIFLTLPDSAFGTARCSTKTKDAALPFGSRTVKLQLGVQTRTLAAAFVPKKGAPLIVGALEHDDKDVHIFDLAKLGEYDTSLGGAQKVGRDNNYATSEIIVAKDSPYFATVGGQKVTFYDWRKPKSVAMVLKAKSNRVKVIALESGKFLMFDETQNVQIVSTDGTTGIDVEPVQSPVPLKNFEAIAVTSYGNKYLVAISGDDGDISLLSLAKVRRVWDLAWKDTLTVTNETLKGVRVWSEAEVSARQLVWLSRPAANAEKVPVLIAAVQANLSGSGVTDERYPGVLTGWKVQASGRAKLKFSPYIDAFKTGMSFVSQLESPKESGHVVLSTSDPASVFSSLKVKETRTKATFQNVWSERLPRNAGVHYLSSSSGPQDPIHSLAVSPDGKTVVVGSDGGVLVKRFVDNRRGREQAAFHGSDIRALTFSDDSRWLAAGGHMGEFYLYQLVSSSVPPRFTDEEEATPRPQDVDTGDFTF
jgi:WD40 repeat protein